LDVQMPDLKKLRSEFEAEVGGTFTGGMGVNALRKRDLGRRAITRARSVLAFRARV
jgi:hypothetical protein